MDEIRLSGGVSFTGLLFITFLVLKLCSVINWSWWWVTAPLWLPGAVMLSIGLIVLIIWIFICIMGFIFK